MLELGVVALGVLLAVTAWSGGERPIVPAVILAVLAIALASSGARLQGGVGDVYARPANLASLHGTYRRAIGDMTLDLGALRGSASSVTSVDASIGIGNLRIVVPAHADGSIEVRVGLGTLNPVEGADRSGFDLLRVVHVFPVGNPALRSRSRLQLRIQATVGRGCVLIDQQGFGGSESCS